MREQFITVLCEISVELHTANAVSGPLQRSARINGEVALIWSVGLNVGGGLLWPVAILAIHECHCYKRQESTLLMGLTAP